MPTPPISMKTTIMKTNIQTAPIMSAMKGKGFCVPGLVLVATGACFTDGDAEVFAGSGAKAGGFPEKRHSP